MCTIPEILLAPAVVALVVLNVRGMAKYYQFKNRLKLFISQEALVRRGEIDGETGELVLRFFFNRTYREFGDAELESLGRVTRRRMILSMLAALATIALVAAIHGSSGSWSSLAVCYGG